MKKIFVSLFLGILFCVSCSDDDEQVLSNELGSKLEIVGDMKVSTFYLPNERLQIDQLIDFKIQISDLNNNKEYTFNGKVIELTPLLKCELYIPKTETLPDGDYLFVFSTSENEILFSSKFTLALEREMVSSILQEQANYSGLNGSGTSEDPYQIGVGNKEGDDYGLTYFFYVLNSDPTHGAGLYFKQICDISAQCQGYNLEGNGHIGASFAGNYDGGGYTIKLSYQGTNSNEQDNFIGFFSELNDGASVSNLTFDVDIRGGGYYMGTVAGASNGDIELKNIRLDGTIEGNYSIGGLIGKSSSGTISIEDITLEVNVTANNKYGGGLIGACDQAKLSIEQVRNIEFRFFVGSEQYAGGLIGYISGSFTINHVRLRHETSGENDPDLIKSTGTEGGTGGLIGKADLQASSKITYSYVNLPITGNENVGGFVGKLGVNYSLNATPIWLLGDTISYCNIKGSNNVGGYIGFWEDVEVGYISDLIQNASVSGENAVGGLIGRVEINGSETWERVTINNITLEMESGVSGTKYVGGAIGYLKCDLQKNHTIYMPDNAFKFSNTITVSGKDCVGGLCGAAYECAFVGGVSFSEDESNTITGLIGKSLYSGKTNTVNSTALSSGGLFGYINNCSVKGFMADGVVYGNTRIGGIVGHAEYSAINYCVRKGESVNANGSETGGVCGRIDNNNLNHTHLVNTSMIKGKSKTGGVVGYVVGKDGTIEYLVNTGEVKGEGSVGGVIGYLKAKETGKDGNIVYFKKSVNFGSITGTCTSKRDEVLGLGGVVGTMESLVNVSESANHGYINAPSNTVYSGIGGVAGVISCASGKSVIKLHSCCNTSTVKIDGRNEDETNVGGIAGVLYEGVNYSQKSSMYDCYNKGDVLGECKADNGGILGNLLGTYSEVAKCINCGNVSNGNYGLGTRWTLLNNNINDIYYYKVGKTGKPWKATGFGDSEKKKKSTFENFSFDSVWKIDNDDLNDGFPYLTNCYYQFATAPTL